MSEIKVGIKLTADGRAAVASLDQVEAAMQRAGVTARRAGAETDRGRQSLSAYTQASRLAAQAVSALAVALTSRQVYDTIAKFDQLNASLKTVTGSTLKATAAMDMIKQFATKTPYQVQEVTDAFIRLRSLGLDASSKSLQSFGNTAAAMGKPLMQFIEAVADASTNEFERLKEFGIKAQQQGDQVTFTFQGVSTTVRKTSADIQSYLLEIGNTKFAGGMTDQMNTVGGAASNLGDAFSNLIDEIGNLGVRDALKKGFAGAAEFINDFKTQIESIAGDTTQGLAAALERRIKEQQHVVAGLKGGLLGSGMFVDTDEINARQREIESMQGALSRLKEQLAQDAKAIGEVGAQAITQATFKGLSAAQSQVAQIVKETAESLKVDPAWALAIAQQESGFNQLAKSAAGAQGVMQLMPGTAKQLGVNIADVNDNIKGGIIYLKQQQEQFKSLKLASAAYNAGPGNVQKYGGVPPFQETQNYVKSVAALYQQWQQVLGTQGTVFADAKEQAGELKNAFEQLKTHQDGMVSAAENYAKVQTEKIKTSLAALESERKATQELTTAQLASAKTYDDKQRLLAAAAQQQEQFNQRAAALAQQELSAQQSVIEARKSALQTELANADKYNLTIIEQAKLKQAIASVDSDLAVLAQQRAQAEIAAGQQVNEAAQQSLALKQKEQSTIDGVIAEYQREIDILDKLTKAKEAGANADTLQTLNYALHSGANFEGLISESMIQQMNQYGISTKVAVQAQNDLIDSAKKQVTAEQAVADQQLRLNAAFQNGVQQAQLFAKHATEAFGQAGEGIGKMAIGIAQFFEQSWQASRDLQTELKKAEQIGPEDNADRIKAEFDAVNKAATRSAQYQIGLFGDITSAAKNYFEEGSKGYSALENASKTFRMFEMAMAVKSMVEQVAANFSMGMSAAPAAVAKAGAQSGWPGAIAMAALMAALGFGVAGAVSGGRGETREDIQKRQGTGSVLGDASAQSESIAHALDIVAENTSNDLNYSAKMLAALENIESALGGAAASIFQNVAPAIANAVGRLGLGRNNLDPLGLDYTSKSITDAGLYVPAQKLSEALKSFSVAMYAQVTSAHKLFGMTISSSSKDYGVPADSQTANQFTKTIRGMRDALIEGGQEFGLSADDFNRRMKKFTIDIGKLSLQDLSGEEAQKAISAVFGKIFDDMTAQLLPSIKKFQSVGEGAAETYFRVASGLAEAKGELAQFGLRIIDFKDITDKHAKDIGGQAFKDSYAAVGNLNQATKDWLKTLKGGAEDVADSIRVYEAAMRAMRVANLSTEGFDPLASGNRVGGLSNLLDAIQTYNEEFLTDAQRFSGATADLSDSFLKLGFAIPASKDAFVELVSSIDLTKAGGNELRAALLLLAESFGETQDRIQGIKDKYADILNPFGKIGAQIADVGSDFGELIKDAATKSESAIDAFRKTRDDQVDAFTKQLSDTAAMRDELTVSLQNRIKQRDDAQKIIDEEMAKAPKKRNAKRLNQAIHDFNEAETAVATLTGFIESSNKEIAGFMAAIEKANADFNAASGEEKAKAAAERGRILSDAQKVMFSTVSDIMQGLAQTIQAAQQKLDNVLSFQKGLESQIAQLQGSQAIADLANARYGQANNAVNDYIGAVGSGSRARDTEEELRLLSDLQTAVMDRYNAEMTLINEAIQEQTNALNEALQVEIDAINAAAQAQVDAVNTALDAQIKAIQDASDAQIKAQQKVNDAAIKAQQKVFDAQTKAQQKANDAVLKAQQKADDAAIKAIQKQQDAELQVWQDHLDAANKLRDAIKGIQDYAKGLLLGPQSVASPEQRLAEAQRQYQEQAAKASGGDADALAKLSGSSDAYLEAAKQYYGSGTQYQSIFDGVKTAMEGLGAMSAPDPDSIQSHIDALRESQAAAIDALREAQSDHLDAIREAQSDQLDLMREQQAEQIDAIREAQGEQLDAMRQATQDQIEAARKSAQSQIDAINKAAQDQIKEAQTRTAQAIKDLSDPNKNAAMKALKDETVKKLQELHDLSEMTRAEAERKAEEARRNAAEQAAEAIQIARDQLARLNDGLTFSGAQLQALNGIMRGLGIDYQVPVPSLRPLEHIAPESHPDVPGLDFTTQLPRHAAGGYAQAGIALVGEKGPEIVRFERPAQVLTAEQTRKALSGSDESKTFAALEDIKIELKAIVNTQSNANPQLIARLANIEDRLNAMERQQRISA